MPNLKKTPIVEKKFLFPFIIITSLFALWGFANDLTNPMVSAFQKVMPELTNVQASLIQFAFYFGYFFMALPAALIIRKFTYKSGIILGLALYAIGAFLFYPAALYEEFNYFLVSLWVITCGLAFLETTANPLILSLGSEDTATRRLNLAQSFNPVGSLTGMLTAQIFVISALRSDDYTVSEYQSLSSAEVALIRENDLGVISIPYLALGIFVLVVLLVFIFSKIPNTHTDDKISISDSFKKLFANKNYTQGVIAQTFYIGAQIMSWTYIFQYVDNLNQHYSEENQLTATWFNMTAMTLFLTSRWIGTLLMKSYQPARLLMWFGIGGVACSAGAVLLPGVSGLISLVFISVFMSIMFPTIYGIALKNMGDEAKLGSAGLIMAIVGGALLPVLQGSFLDLGGKGFDDVIFFGYIPEINASFILPMLCLCLVAYYGYNSYKNENMIT